MADEKASSDISYISEDHCIDCKLGFEDDPAVNVSRKGILTLIYFAEKRGRLELARYLNRRLNTTPIGKVLVHQICRRNFTDSKRGLCESSDSVDLSSTKRLRSSLPDFNYKEDCLFCGKAAPFDPKHTDRTQVHRCSTLPMRESLLDCCAERGDSISFEVQKRLNGCIDLVAAEAVYHSICLSRFKLNKEISPNPSERKQIGRKTDNSRQKLFQKVCVWIESEAGAELYTLSELHDKMVEFAEGSEVYTQKWLKEKLQDHYGSYIFFAEVQGRSNVICFRNMASFIINEKWYTDKKTDIEEEHKRIIMTAAKIIRAQLREMTYTTNSYPTSEDITNIERGKGWIPSHMLCLLEVLIPSELKQISIGHSIIQSARPKSVLAPTLFGLGVELDHMFGSKWLVTELSRLGFSITYDEVERYKQSVIQAQDHESLPSEYFPGSFTQWVADNVDHNVATLDGHGTFHGMGIIAVCTPTDDSPLRPEPQVVIRQKRANVDNIVKDKGIPIHQYASCPEKGLSTIAYKPLIQLQFPHTLPPDMNSDLLWHSGWLFRNAIKPRPNWTGYMQHIFADSGSGPSKKSEVVFLPIIDLNPSDEDCIYSTLVFIQSQANKLNISTPCLTFDQPLWLKAVGIITSRSMNVVCRLGGFHVMMSFLGSIGAMMKGSGLEEALERVYGPNAVQQMVSGKAISRALRGHFLVEAALVNKLVREVVPSSHFTIIDTDQPESDQPHTSTQRKDEDYISSPENEACEHCPTTNEQLPGLSTVETETLRTLFDDVEERNIHFPGDALPDEFIKLEQCLAEYKTLLAEKSPTARLWLQYVIYVQTLKDFIRAERTGDWHLHLLTTGKMLNLFAATGHIHYAKSCRLYLQLMIELPLTHPVLYKSFAEHGFHTVRRSSRFWAGLSTDLIIEQVLMRSIKSRGGLTRGRGMTDSVRQQWVFSMHKCAEIHESMTTLTCAKHNTSEQHIELGTSRRIRDYNDLLKLEQWFADHEPFDMNETKLRSLSSGLTAADGDGVNCDQTEIVGMGIQEKIDGLSVAVASIKKSEHVKALDSLQPGVKIDNKKVHINPTILFSRLIAIAQREENMATYFKYELTAAPTSLFKDNLMRKPTKTHLAKALTDYSEQTNLPSVAMHVVDGGALLHRVKWAKKSTYIEIANQYVCYVRSKYANACVVFDGYEIGPAIKDHEHSRRIGKCCADIRLSENVEAHYNQEAYLSNEKNKTQFIKLLGRLLIADGQMVRNSSGDADTMIVSSALEFASRGTDVIMAADDTDLLILLLYHWVEDMADVYFVSEARKTVKGGRAKWKIRDLVQKAGKVKTAHILFIHAWAGCDTTSATYGQGKTGILKKIESPEIQRISSIMNDTTADKNKVGEAGVKLFKTLYAGKQSDTLNGLRYTKFMEMVSSTRGSLDPQKLPPTERAAYFHSLRVHLQVVIWKTLGNTTMDPTDWGWQIQDSHLVPIMTDLAPAPETLLKFVRCKCKLASRNPCGANLCSCRKNGLKCVVACGDCHGEGCRNSEAIIVGDDEVDVEPLAE